MSGLIKGDPTKRYHLVSCGDNEAGQHIAGLVEGIPDPEKPDDPSRDRKDGTPLITGENYPGSPFWVAVLAADIVWTNDRTGFKRYYEYDPKKAAKIRNGEAA